MNKNEITQEGYDRLVAERDHIDTVEKPRISQVLKEAIALGDLAENAEYITAKEEQANIEKRRAELDDLIATAVIISNESLDSKFLQTGHTVKLKDMVEKETVVFKIVGTTEIDPLNGIISNACPVGQHLLGHKKGDVVEFQVPAYMAKYKILEIYKEDKETTKFQKVKVSEK